jgi:hypothetical protein
MYSLLRNEIKIIWTIFSILIIGLFLTLLFFDSMFLLKNSPKCTSVAILGKNCFLCGTTRGFLQIKKFDFTEAQKCNGLCIPLFIFFLLNSLLFIYFLKKQCL